MGPALRVQEIEFLEQGWMGRAMGETQLLNPLADLLPGQGSNLSPVQVWARCLGEKDWAIGATGRRANGRFLNETGELRFEASSLFRQRALGRKRQALLGDCGRRTLVGRTGVGRSGAKRF